MKLSTDRILTTHVGSLIRPPELQEFLRAKQAGQPYDEAAYARTLKDTVAAGREEAGRSAASTSSATVNSASRISWSQYVLDRLGGFERRPFKAGNTFARGADRSRFSDFYAELDAQEQVATTMDLVVVGADQLHRPGVVAEGHRQLQSGAGEGEGDGRLPAGGGAGERHPGPQERVLQERRRGAGGDRAAMRDEYKQIIDNGLLVQLDDARTAVTFDRMVPPGSLQDYLKWVARHVEILNEAIKGLPREKIRYHVCWGSWPGPHTTDIPLKTIVNLILKLKVGAFVIEGANPRHEHEWRVWEDVKLPKDVALIPGVISHATNIVEHPELVQQRIVRLAKLVGRENVLASTDCGFAQGPFYRRVHPSIMWAKLQALVEGARLATKELWGSKKSAKKKVAATRSSAKAKRPAAKRKRVA